MELNTVFIIFLAVLWPIFLLCREWLWLFWCSVSLFDKIYLKTIPPLGMVVFSSIFLAVALARWKKDSA